MARRSRSRTAPHGSRGRARWEAHRLTGGNNGTPMTRTEGPQVRAISNGAATDQARALVDAIKESAAELEGYPVDDMTDDVEVAG